MSLVVVDFLGLFPHRCVFYDAVVLKTILLDYFVVLMDHVSVTFYMPFEITLNKLV